MVKILIISDLHLGNDASKAPALLDGVARIARNYDRTILNGDTLDVYAPRTCEAGNEVRALLEEASSPPSAKPFGAAGNYHRKS